MGLQYQVPGYIAHVLRPKTRLLHPRRRRMNKLLAWTKESIKSLLTCRVVDPWTSLRE